MRTKTYFGTSLVFLVTFICCHTNLMAQSPPKKTTPKNTEMPDDKGMAEIGYCDELVTKSKKELQGVADKKCETQTVCLKCRERESGQAVYMMMFVEPNPSTCKVATYEAQNDAQAAQKPKNIKSAVSAQGFQAEIIQSTCTKNGTSLEVFIVGNDLAACAKGGNEGYTFLWEVDGKKAGHDRRIECVCGKEVSVRITQGSTGTSVNKRLNMQPCSSDE